ncbi:(4Fe-4S)-binding protein [Desulfosarcina alkanivorans]|uniref:(4Fe-4S)-binding protein n=1 Tax=Desulfosarcina alkanivorans TaxID=571177 RepID=A0A5K7YPH7_9BACT|nr:4Fe-4S binding protein [Desulfosarcina alkanivorans]BBO68821.1 (4Fe-4S)-binding protein [Desulfosarcina alkanivorans]
MTPLTLSEKIRRATGVICRQGLVQFPVTDTAVAIIRQVVGDQEDELDLIDAFRERPSQTMDQLVASSGLSEAAITRLTDSLAGKGLVFNQPSSSGIMVYRLLPLMMVGLMEYRFMGELTGSDGEKALAGLFERLLAELREQTQGNYDALMPLFAAAPAIDRTVPADRTAEGRKIRVIPVEKPVEGADEVILPSQTVEAIINKFDDIAVGHCFCRQRRSLLGEPCSTNAPVLNCFSFGKSARHTSAQGFAKKVTREEALRILREAQQAGLIHKAFHPGSRESSPETSICNCCKDCCDTLRLWRDGSLPMINSTYHLSVIDRDACSGCGTCLEWCPTDAIEIDEDGVARRDENACLGCGVCARFCPESAISLQEGFRKVFILPPRLRSA